MSLGNDSDNESDSARRKDGKTMTRKEAERIIATLRATPAQRARLLHLVLSGDSGARFILSGIKRRQEGTR